MPNRFGSHSLSIDQVLLTQTNSCSIFYLRRNILTKHFWNQKTPLWLFFLFRAFWVMTEVYCGYRDLTLVVQNPESPVEDKLQRLLWLKENRSGCAGSNWSPSVSVFWDMVSDNRCPGKSIRTGWRLRDISSIPFHHSWRSEAKHPHCTVSGLGVPVGSILTALWSCGSSLEEKAEGYLGDAG